MLAIYTPRSMLYPVTIREASDVKRCRDIDRYYAEGRTIWEVPVKCLP